jgi:hypothetical protein
VFAAPFSGTFVARFVRQLDPLGEEALDATPQPFAPRRVLVEGAVGVGVEVPHLADFADQRLRSASRFVRRYDEKCGKGCSRSRPQTSAAARGLVVVLAQWLNRQKGGRLMAKGSWRVIRPIA